MLIEIANYIPLFTRYNGGWIKQINGINKEKTDGYSLEGEFLKICSGLIRLHENELYLDCSIGGSRKHFLKNYTLFKIVDEEVIILQEIEGGGRDWALRLWETIENELNSKPSQVDILYEKIKQLNEKDFSHLMQKLNYMQDFKKE